MLGLGLRWSSRLSASRMTIEDVIAAGELLVAPMSSAESWWMEWLGGPECETALLVMNGEIAV